MTHHGGHTSNCSNDYLPKKRSWCKKSKKNDKKMKLNDDGRLVVKLPDWTMGWKMTWRRWVQQAEFLKIVCSLKLVEYLRYPGVVVSTIWFFAKASKWTCVIFIMDLCIIQGWWVVVGNFLFSPLNPREMIQFDDHMGVSLNGGTPKTPQNDHF